MQKSLSLATLALLISACSFVELRPEAQHVILSNDESSCKRLGETTVSVMHEVGFFDRSEDTVADELLTLAKNSSAKMGGNAVWPASEIEEGEQSFVIYRCRLD